MLSHTYGMKMHGAPTGIGVIVTIMYIQKMSHMQEEHIKFYKM